MQISASAPYNVCQHKLGTCTCRHNSIMAAQPCLHSVERNNSKYVRIWQPSLPGKTEENHVKPQARYSITHQLQTGYPLNTAVTAKSCSVNTSRVRSQTRSTRVSGQPAYRSGAANMAAAVALVFLKNMFVLLPQSDTDRIPHSSRITLTVSRIRQCYGKQHGAGILRRTMFLGACALTRKPPINIVMSVCSHVSARLRLNGFASNFILAIFL
jgi:hypothetical protein